MAESKGSLVPIEELLDNPELDALSPLTQEKIFTIYAKEDPTAVPKIANHPRFATLAAARRDRFLDKSVQKGQLKQVTAPTATPPKPAQTPEAENFLDRAIRNQYPQSSYAQIPPEKVGEVGESIGTSAAIAGMNVLKDLSIGARQFIAAGMDKINPAWRETLNALPSPTEQPLPSFTPFSDAGLHAAWALAKKQDPAALELERNYEEVAQDLFTNAPELLNELNQGLWEEVPEGTKGGFVVDGKRYKFTDHAGLVVVKNLVDSAVYLAPMALSGRGAAALFQSNPLYRFGPRMSRFVGYGAGGGSIVALGTGGDAADMARQIASEYKLPDGKPLFTEEQIGELSRQAQFRGTTLMFPVAFVTNGIGLGLTSGASKSWTMAFVRGTLGDAVFEGAEEAIDLFISNIVNNRIVPTMDLVDAFFMGIAASGAQGGLNAMIERGISVKDLQTPPPETDTAPPSQKADAKDSPTKRNVQAYTLPIDPQELDLYEIGSPLEFEDSQTGQVVQGTLVNKTPDGNLYVEVEGPPPKPPGGGTPPRKQPTAPTQLELDFPEEAQQVEEPTGQQAFEFVSPTERKEQPRQPRQPEQPARPAPEVRTAQEDERSQAPDTREAPPPDLEPDIPEAPVEDRPAPRRPFDTKPETAPTKPPAPEAPEAPPEAEAPVTPTQQVVEDVSPKDSPEMAQRASQINDVMRRADPEAKREIARRATRIRKADPELTQLDAIEQAIQEVYPPAEVVQPPEVPTPQAPLEETPTAPPAGTQPSLKDRVAARRAQTAPPTPQAPPTAAPQEPTTPVTPTAPVAPAPSVPQVDFEQAKAAIAQAQENPAYARYRDGIQQETASRYGDPFPAFTAVTEAEMDAWAEGQAPPLPFTPIPELARAEQEASGGTKIVFAVEAPVKAILLAGPNSTVVLDTAQLSFEDAELVPFDEGSTAGAVSRPEEELSPERILELRQKIEAREKIEAQARPEVSSGPAPATRLSEVERASEDKVAEERERERLQRLREQEEFMRKRKIQPLPAEKTPQRREVGSVERVTLDPTVQGEAPAESRAVKEKQGKALKALESYSSEEDTVLTREGRKRQGQLRDATEAATKQIVNRALEVIPESITTPYADMVERHLARNPRDAKGLLHIAESILSHHFDGTLQEYLQGTTANSPSGRTAQLLLPFLETQEGKAMLADFIPILKQDQAYFEKLYFGTVTTPLTLNSKLAENPTAATAIYDSIEADAQILDTFAEKDPTLLEVLDKDQEIYSSVHRFYELLHGTFRDTGGVWDPRKLTKKGRRQLVETLLIPPGPTTELFTGIYSGKTNSIQVDTPTGEPTQGFPQKSQAHLHALLDFLQSPQGSKLFARSTEAFLAAERQGINDPISKPKLPANTASEAFKLWFAGSKIIEPDGSPKVVYHGTFAEINFDTFSKGDLGFHFGTREQASTRAEQSLNEHIAEEIGLYGATDFADKSAAKQAKERRLKARQAAIGKKGIRILPVFLNIKNPVILQEDVGMFDDPTRVAGALGDAGYLTEAELGTIQELEPDSLLMNEYGGTVPYHDESFQFLRDTLQAKGFDGLIYPNRNEGSGLSYIVFEPNQVKSAIGNAGTYRRESPSILFSKEGQRKRKATKKRLGLAEDPQDNLDRDLPEDLDWLTREVRIPRSSEKLAIHPLLVSPIKATQIEVFPGDLTLERAQAVGELNLGDVKTKEIAERLVSNMERILGKDSPELEIGQMVVDELGHPIKGSAGIYKPGSNILGIATRMALDSDIDMTLTHEITHAARFLKLSKLENRILDRKFAAGSETSKRLADFMVANKQGERLTQLDLTEERIAHGTSMYMHKGFRLDSSTNKILAKLQEFYERLTNWWLSSVLGKEMGTFDLETGRYTDNSPETIHEYVKAIGTALFTAEGRAGFQSAKDVLDALFGGSLKDRVGRTLNRRFEENPQEVKDLNTRSEREYELRETVETQGKLRATSLVNMIYSAMAERMGGDVRVHDTKSLVHATLLSGQRASYQGMIDTMRQGSAVDLAAFVAEEPAFQDRFDGDISDILDFFMEIAEAQPKPMDALGEFIERVQDAIVTTNSDRRAGAITSAASTFLRQMGELAAITALPETGVLSKQFTTFQSKDPGEVRAGRLIGKPLYPKAPATPTVVKTDDSNFIRDRELAEVDGSDSAAHERFIVATGLRDIDSSEGVQALLKRVRLRINPTKPFTAEEAHRMASGTGLSDKAVARLHVAGPHEVEKAMKVLTAAVTDVQKAIQPAMDRIKHKMRPGVKQDFNLTDTMTPEEVVRWDKARLRADLLFQVLDTGGGIPTEAGRLLQSMKRFKSTRESLREELQDMLDLRNGHIALSRAMLRLEQLRDARELGEFHKFNHSIGRATTADKLVELWYMSVLSHPMTWMRNIVGAGAFIGTGPLERVMGAGMGRAIGAIVEPNRKDHLDIREVKSQITGMVAAQRIGMALAWETFKTDTPSDPATKLQMHAGHAMGNSLPVKALRKISTTALMASDEYLKSVAFFGEGYALIERQVRVKENLDGQAFDDRVEFLRQSIHGWRAAVSEATTRKLNEHLTDNETDFLIRRSLEEFVGKPVSGKDLDIIRSIYEDSLKESRWKTLTAKGGILAELGPKFVASLPAELQPYGRLLVALGIPFLRLTLESVKRVLPRTPIGIAGLISPKGLGRYLPAEVSEGLQRGGAAGDLARGKIIFGNMLFGAGIWMAMQGLVTPSCGVLSRGRAGALQAGGGKCSSIWDPVSESYIDISGFEPVSKLFTVAADAVELLSRDDKLPKDFPDELMGFIGELVSIQTFKGMPTLYKALAEGRANPGSNLLGNIAVGFVPNIVKLPQEFIDPYARAQTGFFEKVQRKTPILAFSLPNDVTALGDPIRHTFYKQKLPKQLAEALIDTKSSRYRQVKLPRAGRKLKTSEGDRGVMVDLNAAQWTAYQIESGKKLKRWLTSYVRTSAWKRLPIEDLQAEINKKVSQYRTDAAASVRRKWRREFRILEREARTEKRSKRRN